jgi:hypothetical protein
LGTVAPEKKQSDRNESADHDDINPGILLFSCCCRHGIRRCSAFNSLWRYFEHPGQNQRDRQADNDEQNKQADQPIRNIEDWKNLRDSLREGPATDNVSNRDFMNVAPL